MNTVGNRHTDENQSRQVTESSKHFLISFVASIIHYRHSMSRTLGDKKEKKESISQSS